MKFEDKKWPAIILPITTAILGFLAQVILEWIGKPLIHRNNLPHITIIIISILFLTTIIIFISLWNKIDKLSRVFGLRVTFLPVGKGNSKMIYTYLADIIKNADNEVLVFTYHLVRELIDGICFDKSVLLSRERKNYFKEISKKLDLCEKGKFKFQRIVQLPKDKGISKLEDSIFLTHLKILMRIGEKHTEFACVKKCDRFYENTFLIIDRQYLLLQVGAIDPKDDEFYTKGYLLFEDTTGKSKLLKEYLGFFENVNARAKLLNSSDFFSNANI